MRRLRRPSISPIPPPSPPPPPPGGELVPGWGPTPALGSYHGVGGAFDYWGSLRGYQHYDNWLGRPGNIAKGWMGSTAQQGNGDWDGLAGGAGDADSTWQGALIYGHTSIMFNPDVWPVSLPVVVAVPGVPDNSATRNINNGTWRSPSIWSEVAQGNFDVYYRRLFRRIATKCGLTGRDPNKVVIRFAWEANGDWYPWSIGPDKASFISAFRRVVTIMRTAVGQVLGTGKKFLVEFGPSPHLRFGAGGSERLWNIYPGDDYVDICGCGIHDHVGMTVQADWNAYLHYPATIGGTPFEGYIDWFDFAISRNKLVGTSEIESNRVAHPYFPRTQNMGVMWTTGFEPLRQRYVGRFAYFIYLYYSYSALHVEPSWSEPYRQLYKP